MNVLAGRRQLLALGPLYIEHPPPSQEESRWGSLHGFSEGCEPSQEGPPSSLLFPPDEGQSLLPQILWGHFLLPLTLGFADRQKETDSDGELILDALPWA